MELTLNVKCIWEERTKESHFVFVPKDSLEILTTIAVSIYDLMMCYNYVIFKLVSCYALAKNNYFQHSFFNPNNASKIPINECSKELGKKTIELIIIMKSSFISNSSEKTIVKITLRPNFSNF